MRSSSAGTGRTRSDGACGDRQALHRLLGGDDTAWLVDRVRSRLPGAEGQPLTGVVRLREPSQDQRAAVTRLLGPPRRPATTLAVDLAVLEQMLRRGPWPAGLADAVVTLTGPAVDRRAIRATEEDQWARAAAALRPAAAHLPDLLVWWDTWCAAGNLKRAARAEAGRRGVPPGPGVAADLVAQLRSVLDPLPVPPTPLAVFSRQTVGEAHGLDESRALGRMASAAVAAAFADRQPGDGMTAREAWARAGVVLSNVSSTVLVLGVRGRQPRTVPAVEHGTAARATAEALEAMHRARTPMVLTLDQVRTAAARPVPPGSVLHVCENPTVVEVVAARWAAAGVTGREPVLVCTSGQPSTAVVELVQHLAAAGGQVRYHGDFDWPGLRIAAALADRVPWTPWRYTAADYEAACTAGLPLRGSPAASPWDPELAASMARHGLAIEEEAVVDDLVADLLAPQAISR